MSCNKKYAQVFFCATIAVLLLPRFSICQIQGAKVGGISFRVDDNQQVNQWIGFSKVFAKYGYNFSFALNLGELTQNEPYINLIKNLQNQGNELMDHSPNHSTQYFTSKNASEYLGMKGVSHIVGDKVCLAYDDIDTTLSELPRGIADINSNFVVSTLPNAFRFIDNDVDFIYFGIYFPTINKVFKIQKLNKPNNSGLDTLYILDFWNTPVKMGNYKGLPYIFVRRYDIKMSSDGIGLLAEQSIQFCNANNLKRPYVWVQPGGPTPNITPTLLKSVFGDRYEYKGGAGYINNAFKCYNEYNPLGEKQFAFGWGDFYDDTKDLQTNKAIIADKVAKHYFLIGHSHFSNLLNGWEGYLARVDSILRWCFENKTKIQVKTHSQIINQLYSEEQNPYINVFPPLNVDLDENGIPDGYYNQPTFTDGLLDTTDGAAENGNYSYTINRKGSILFINGLAGLEKGENDFFIWTKGFPGDSIEVKFDFPETKNSVLFKFPASSSTWTRYGVMQSTNSSKALIIPNNVSYCNIRVSCSNYAGGTVKVSGFVLRKKIEESLKIISTPITVATVNSEYKYQPEIFQKEMDDTLLYSLVESPEWLTVYENGLIFGKAPNEKREFLVKLRVANKHGYAETQSFKLEVKGTSILYSSTNRINLGTITSKQKFDTTITIKNLGNDTLEINAIYVDGVEITCEYSKTITQGGEGQIKVSFTSNKNDSIKTYCVVYSNSSTSPDTFYFIGKFSSPNQFAGYGMLPAQFSVSQNFPNPFNAGTVLNYALKLQSRISMTIYNVLGQSVKRVKANNVEPAGYYQVHWNGDDDKGMPLSSGIYFYRILISPVDGSNPKEFVKKMVLLR